MGKITLFVSEELSGFGPGDSTSETTVNSDSRCSVNYSFSAKTSSTCWVDFVFDLAPGTNYSMTPSTVTGGEVLTNGIKAWNLLINGFVSQNQSQNILQSTVTINLYDSEGGTLIESKSITRLHTNLTCE